MLRACVSETVCRSHANQSAVARGESDVQLFSLKLSNITGTGQTKRF